jgi:integrase/recombinase XerD
VNKITVHGLRHTFATHIVNGSPQGLKAAQKALGHSSISTTEIYTHLSADEYGQAMAFLLS